MNVHESEKLAGIMRELGYEVARTEEEADVILFNTCCIRENAEDRARGNIGALKKLKQKNKDLIIAVDFCRFLHLLCPRFCTEFLHKLLSLAN